MYYTYNHGLAWTQQQKLVASNGATNDHAGVAVVVQNDTIVVGALRHDADKGNMYFFIRLLDYNTISRVGICVRQR